MTVTAVRKDADKLTLTVDAEFDASAERVWQLWADPRQLERWWGPPTYPATFTQHDLAPGSRVQYHMTGPEGDQPKGYWDILEVDAPHRLVVRDGFANDDGTPNDDFPTGEMRVTIQETGGGRTRMSIESLHPSPEAMEQVLAMGMEEGITEAVGQIDAILAEDPVASRALNRWRIHRWRGSSAPGSSSRSSRGGRWAADVRRSSGSRTVRSSSSARTRRGPILGGWRTPLARPRPSSDSTTPPTRSSSSTPTIAGSSVSTAAP